jgi:hypothetical protein
MAVLFGRDTPGQNRIWVEIDNSQFPDGNNNDKKDDVINEIREWGDLAIKTWIDEMKVSEKEKGKDWENLPLDNFMGALDSDKMKPFISEWGFDSLLWKPTGKN